MTERERPPKFLGWANGWENGNPPELTACWAAREAGEEHETYSRESHSRCVSEYGCYTCGFYYKIDSGD